MAILICFYRRIFPKKPANFFKNFFGDGGMSMGVSLFFYGDFFCCFKGGIVLLSS